MTKPLIGWEEKSAPKKPKAVKRLKVVGGSRFPERRNYPLQDFTKTFPCAIAGKLDRAGIAHHCFGDVVPAHLKTKGSGGNDDDNMVPLCHTAHLLQEGKTKDFEYRWNVRLKPIAKRITAAFYAKAKHG